MIELKKKVAYLQGLAEGLNIEKNSKEGKLFTAMMEVLDQIAEAISDLAEDQADMEEYLEAIDQDLGDLEKDYYGDDGCECDECDEYEEDSEDECEDYIEVECPKCHDIVRFEASILDDDDIIEVTCPNCDEVVYVNDDGLEMEEDKENN